MKNVLRKCFELVSSWRMAVWLIIAFLIIVTAGQVAQNAALSHNTGLIPKAAKAIGLKNVYTSRLFYVLAALLFLNVSFCMASRIKILFADGAGREAGGAFWGKKHLPMLGSLLFHLSLLVIIAGACHSAATRMKGIVFITEGEVFTDRHEEYIALSEAPLFFENHENFRLRMDKVSIMFDGGAVTDIAGRVTVIDGGESVERVVRVNYPLVYKNTSYMMKRYGFAPLFILSDGNGREIFRSYVKISSESGRNEDNFTVSGAGLTVRVKLSPDAEVAGGRMKQMSHELKNPLMEIQIDREIEGGRLRRRLYKGLHRPGDTAEFGGYKLTLGDWRYWMRLDATKDRGQNVLFAGFWLGAAGAALRFIAAFGFRPLGFLRDG